MKTLKKFILPAFIAVLGAYSASGQQSYIRVNTGYSLGAIKSDFYDFQPWLISNADGPIENNSFSLGQGFNIGGAYGYMFNKHVGAEIAASYFMGGKSTLRTTSDDVMTSIDQSVQMFQFAPSFVLQAGFEKWNPYARVGMVFGLGSIDQTMSWSWENNQARDKSTYSGSLALGFTGSLGINYTMNEKFSLFAECTFIGLNYAPTEGRTYESTLNGQNRLDDLAINQKEFIFSDDYDANADVDINQPSVLQRKYYPMSSFGLNIGLQMKF